MTDERQQLLEDAKSIIAASPSDDPSNSDVIDAALTHLIESLENLEVARQDLDPTRIKRFNTSVLRLRYRTTVESNRR